MKLELIQFLQRLVLSGGDITLAVDRDEGYDYLNFDGDGDGCGSGSLKGAGTGQGYGCGAGVLCYGEGMGNGIGHGDDCGNGSSLEGSEAFDRDIFYPEKKPIIQWE